jgi:hypothetical protein
MAQTQSPTNEGYGELGKFLSGEAATKVKSVCCIKTSCTADETQTSAGVTKSTDTGLDLQDADTVASSKTTVNNDTVQVDNKFTSATGDTIKGFGVWNDDDDVLYAICCFAADVVLAASDTLTVQMKMQFKKGS